VTATTDKQLRARFDGRGSVEIYSQPPQWTEEDWESALDVFNEVRDFYQDAAEGGDVMLLWFA
jgi:hypothetical protein